MKSNFFHKIGILLIGLAILTTLWANSLKIGPASLKLYPICILFLMLLFVALGNTKIIFRIIVFYPIIAVWCVLLGWKIVSSVNNEADLSEFFQNFLSSDVAAIVLFCSILYFITSAKQLKALVFFVFFLIVISGGVAILQWLDVAGAWHLQEFLNPRQDDIFYGNITENFLVPGLAPRSFILGYYLASGALLALPVVFSKRNNLFWTALFFFLLLSLIVLQQRGALVALVVGAIFFFYGWKKYFKSWGCITSLTGVIFVLFFVIQGGFLAAGRYEIYRLWQFHDDQRMALFGASLEYFEEAFLFGIPPERFYNEVSAGVAPHNLFLNAYVYYGFFGFLLCCAMLYLLIVLLMKTGRLAVMQQSPLGMGIVLAVIGHLINSQFHNASFFMGDFFVWWLIAFTILYYKFNKQPT